MATSSSASTGSMPFPAVLGSLSDRMGLTLTPARTGSELVPGLALVGAGLVGALSIHAAVDSISTLVAAIVIGAILGNLGAVRPIAAPGVKFAAKRLMRLGVILLGFRLSLGQIRDLGIPTLAVVVITVVATFFGAQAIGRRMGLSPGFSMLVGTGFSICGLSAIAAVEDASGATEEEVATAIGLVTLCGTLAIFVIPWASHVIGLTDEQTGTWIGASVHDTAQVVAAASAAGSGIVAVAIAVKLTRVLLLAPIVAGVNLWRARQTPGDVIEGKQPSPVPLFVALFLLCMLVRTSGVLSDSFLDTAKTIEGLVLAAAMVGLGTGVDVRQIRTLGIRPLVLGAVAWVGVAAVSLGTVYLTT